MATQDKFDVVDAVSDLLQAEQANLFHFLADADPYVHPAIAELRKPLRQVIANTLSREGELAWALVELGSSPLPPAVNPEFQYFAFLSIDFLIPKLLEAKEQSIRRYEALIGPVAPWSPETARLLKSHLDQHRSELEELRATLSHLSALKRPLSQAPDAAHKTPSDN